MKETESYAKIYCLNLFVEGKGRLEQMLVSRKIYVCSCACCASEAIIDA